MQVLFHVCCLVAVASAGLVYPASYGHDFQDQQSLYPGLFNQPSHEIGPKGVPYDTEEVAAAKAVHLAAHAEVKARLAYGHGAQNNDPIDTPEVQVAKFQHQIAFAEAKQRLANPALALPLDTPEVQIAKQEHFAKFAEEKFRNSHPQIGQVAGPVDTVEVQVAKLDHMAKYAAEKARNSYPAFAHAAGPVDTPEVQQAKIEHFHAKAQAEAQQYQHGSGLVNHPTVGDYTVYNTIPNHHNGW